MGELIWLCRQKFKVNLRPSFEQTLYTLSPRCFFPRFSLKAFLVLEKKTCRMDPAATLFSGPEPFEQIANTFSTEGPM